jgi:Tetratricopeptide repeat
LLYQGRLLDEFADHGVKRAEYIAHLLPEQVLLTGAAIMLQQALAGKENVLGRGHSSTLDITNNLGLLYADQGKLDEADKMYKRTLAGKE